MVSKKEQAMRTKEAIIEAFRDLASTTPITSISVAAIAKKSGLSERTFYNHFSDKYDLAAYEMNSLGRNLFKNALLHGTFYDYQLEVTDYYRESLPDYMRNISRASSNDSSFSSLVERERLSWAYDYLRAVAEPTQDLDYLHFCYGMWPHAMCSNHSKWYRGQLDMTLEKLTEWEISALPPQVSPYFDFPAMRKKYPLEYLESIVFSR